MNCWDMIREAEMFARGAHLGQKHGDRPYCAHLQDVVRTLKSWKHDNESMICGAWLHDTIEDTPANYQDIRNLFGEDVAGLVWLVTDELGRDRKERKEKTYHKIFASMYSTVLKLADLTSNIKYAFSGDFKIRQMYKKEWPEMREKFREALTKWEPALLPVLDQLQEIVEDKT